MSRARSARAICASSASARAASLAPADPVQGGVVQQVLHHRKIEVEGAGLEYDPEQAQRLARGVGDVVAENGNMALLNPHRAG